MTGTEAVKCILTIIGEADLDRPGIKDTPKRVIKALKELTWGSRLNEGEFLDGLTTLFPDEPCDQMVAVSGISFTSLCEHHLLPFMGTAVVAYIPKDSRVLGLSKLARLVHFYAARLQIQERMTRQIASALEGMIGPLGIGVCLQARHSCMEVRGAKAVGAVTTTTDLRGVIRESAPAREEFLSLTR